MQSDYSTQPGSGDYEVEIRRSDGRSVLTTPDRAATLTEYDAAMDWLLRLIRFDPNRVRAALDLAGEPAQAERELWLDRKEAWRTQGCKRAREHRERAEREGA